MVKKQNNNILIILSIIAVATIFFIGPQFGLFSVIGETSDGFVLYGDSGLEFSGWVGTDWVTGANLRLLVTKSKEYSGTFWDGQVNYRWDKSSGGITSSISGNDFEIVMSDTGNDYISIMSSLISKEDFSEKNFRANLDIIFTKCYDKGKSTLTIDVGGQNFILGDDLMCNGYSCSITDSGLLEISPNVIDDNVKVFWKGELLKELQNPVKPYNLKFSFESQCGNLIINNPRYQLQFSCKKDVNDVLMMQKFEGGDLISLDTLSYEPKSFCLANPAIITDEGKGGSVSTAEIYEVLVENGEHVLESDQSMVLFYLFDNEDGAVSVNCDEGYYFNPYTISCEDISQLGVKVIETNITREINVSVDRPVLTGGDFVNGFSGRDDLLYYLQYLSGSLFVNFGATNFDGDFELTHNFGRDVLSYGDIVSVNDYLQVGYTGVIDYTSTDTYDYDVEYLFNVFEDKGLTISIPEQDLVVNEDGETILNVLVNNNFGVKVEGGVEFRISSKTLFTGERVIVQPEFFEVGENSIEILLPADKYGESTVVVKPFIKLVETSYTKNEYDEVKNKVSESYILVSDSFSSVDYFVEENVVELVEGTVQDVIVTDVFYNEEIVWVGDEVDDGSPVKAILVGIVVLFGLYLLFEAGGSRGLIQKKRRYK